MTGEAPPQTLNLVDLIGQLAPPVEPSAISMMPQTTGWAVLGLALAIGLGIAAWRGARAWRANAYRRAALAALNAAGNDPVAIAGILRRTALAAYPRVDVAGLSGADWLAFLDAIGIENAFGDGPGRAVATAPYRPNPDTTPELADLAAHWIRRHRRGIAP